MLEIPEAAVIAGQMNKYLTGRKINQVIAAATPHKFAWFTGDAEQYPNLLMGKTIGATVALAGRVETEVEDVLLHFGDGASPRLYQAEEKRPTKHQLLVGLDDGSALICTVAMYGLIGCFHPGEVENFYYNAAKNAVSPLSDTFNYSFFIGLLNEKSANLSVKAFLATEQRIPGLGNGVLHDILLNAALHPKKKMNALSEEQMRVLFDSVKSTLAQMTAQGGRDTERDLLGNNGQYHTKLSSKTYKQPCPHCGGLLVKENYLGGSIYYCSDCQEK